MSHQVIKSVGLKGVNAPQDVKTIQEMLNHALPAEGGPEIELQVDGLCGSKTTNAIGSFQRHHFGWSKSDSRVDPGHRTHAKLNEIWSRPVKGTAIVMHRLPHDNVLSLAEPRDWVFEVSVSRLGRHGRSDPPALFQFAHSKFRKPVSIPKNAFGFAKSSVLLVTRSSHPISIDEVAGPAVIESSGPAGDGAGIPWITSFRRGPVFGIFSGVHLDPAQPADGPWTKQHVANHLMIRYRGELRRIQQVDASSASQTPPNINRLRSVQAAALTGR